MEDIIERYDKHINLTDEEKFKWQKIYNDKYYFEYPYIIKKFIEFNKITGIESLDDLKYLDMI